MSYILFSIESEELSDCPEYWQRFINSFDDVEGDDDYCSQRAANVRTVLAQEYYGYITKADNECMEVQFDTEQDAMFFVLRWQ